MMTIDTVCIFLLRRRNHAAMVLGKHMNALKMWALQEMEASASQKNRFLAGGLEASLGQQLFSSWEQRSRV